MRIDPENPKHLIADEGKVFQRKYDLLVLGNEVILGYYKYDGVYRMETADDFIEIDEPEPINPDFPEID